MGVKTLPGAQGAADPRHRFNRTKTDTAKQMEHWAYEGRDIKAMELGRHLGQMTENVTEEKKLHEHLMELAKERQRFLSTNRYEKRLFLDKQKRKSAVLKETLEHVNPENLPKMKESSPRTAAKGRGEGLVSLPSAGKLLNRRTNKPDSAPLRRPEAMVNEQQKLRAHTSFSDSRSICSDATSDSGMSIPEDQRVFQTEPRKLRKHHMANNKLPNIVPQVKTGGIVANKEKRENSPRAMPALYAGSRRMSVRPVSFEYEKLATWAKKDELVPTQEERSGPQSDTRYVELKESLSEAHRNGQQTVRDLVQRISSLRGQDLLDKRPKMNNRIRNHVLNQGFLVSAAA